MESNYVREVHLGETIAPYRALTARTGVLPLSDDHILTPDEVDDQDGLSHWWADVESIWEAGRKPSETKPLLERFDYHQQISRQLPLAPHRVVYSKAGTNLAAARLEDSDAVIDHKLYWAATESAAEGRYLVAILNSATLLRRVQPLQTKGLLGPRDFDKYVFHIPFPTYDSANNKHGQLVDLAAQAEDLAARLDLEGINSTKARARIRGALTDAGLTEQIEAAVEEILPRITP